MQFSRITLIFTLLASSLSLFSGCIKKEAPNAEADILKIILPEGAMTDDAVDYGAPFSQKYGAYPLIVSVGHSTDLTDLAPRFELTPGASVVPESGSRHDFTQPVFYTVTSEDGNWQRRYAVIITHGTLPVFPETFTFETVRMENGYHEFYDGDITWGSGNRGFAITSTSDNPEVYPTYRSAGGIGGSYCAVLETRTTGSLGAMAGKPIAAGNLFLGTFDLSMALSDALGATKFGIAYTHKPLAVKGYYKYVSGPEYYLNGVYRNDIRDKASITAIFYESTVQTPTLDGHLYETGWKHPNMIANARIGELDEAEEWTEFNMPLDYGQFGKDIDAGKMSGGKYFISLIFSSSTSGGEFKGAPGSRLMIDNVTIVYGQPEE